MVSRYDIKKYIEKNKDVEDFPYIYKEEDDSVYDKDGEYLCSLDTFLDIYKRHSGQSFECIYSEEVLLKTVLKCTECGTVIFTRDDEWFDPHLKCPTCTDYNTHFEYWTKEDIESDERKQEILQGYKEMAQHQKEYEERRKRRNGKYDWQIAIKEFCLKKRYIKLSLECDNIMQSYFKGLRLKVQTGKKGDVSYTINKYFTIPLSWSVLKNLKYFKR